MTIQFKDKALEVRLHSKAHADLSASQAACRDLWRYEWLLESQPPLQLTEPEKYAFASLLKSIPQLLQPSKISRLALLVEDALKSSRHSLTGKPSKEHTWRGFNTEAFCSKLYAASPLQLFQLLERAEKISEEEITGALLAQK